MPLAFCPAVAWSRPSAARNFQPRPLNFFCAKQLRGVAAFEAFRSCKLRNVPAWPWMAIATHLFLATSTKKVAKNLLYVRK
jgi:hypothetical protein